QQRLILPTTPRGFQVDQQRLHRREPALACASLTKRPSLAYFRDTERAAICAISAPRCPSRNPPRNTKFWNQLHGVANHNAPRQLRLPCANICWAAKVV